MLNYNGQLYAIDSLLLPIENRALRYGDSLFETLKVFREHINFWEDHYLRLMASMRILRMEIPMNFTMEFLEEQILEVVAANELSKTPARIRFTVFRNNGGLYFPADNNISYSIEVQALENPHFILDKEAYEVDLFKDYYVNADLLSSLKSNNRIINVLGSIYAEENDYANCLLLNNNKQVVEALNGNIFLVKDTMVITPPIKDGCLNGIIRKKLISLIQKSDTYKIQEASISAFELHKADELFITNSIVGIRPVTNYRKASYGNTAAAFLLELLNNAAKTD